MHGGNWRGNTLGAVALGAPKMQRLAEVMGAQQRHYPHEFL